MRQNEKGAIFFIEVCACAGFFFSFRLRRNVFGGLILLFPLGSGGVSCSCCFPIILSLVPLLLALQPLRANSFGS